MNEPRAHMRAANYVSVRKAYLDEVVAPVFSDISRATATIEKHYSIAGKDICFKFYSPVLAERLTSAFAHLEVQTPEHVDLTVHAWDAVSGAVAFAPPWSDARYVFEQATDAKATLDGNFKGVYLHGEETLTLYDADTATAYFWTEDAHVLPSWVSAAPFRTLLHWFLSASDVHLVHGAVVGVGGAAVLMSARGGSGKSTTALACLLSGMEYLADDYAAIGGGDDVMAYSLYNSVKVRPGGVHAWRELASHVRSTEGEKDIVYLSEVFPEQVVASLPLRAIIIPTIAHTETTRVVPIGKAAALLALAPTTLFQLPLAETSKMETLKNIIERLPCYAAELGTDSAEAAAVIKDFILTELC